MKVLIKKLNPDAVIPSYAKEGDAGMDLTAVSVDQLDSEHLRYNFGIAIEIPVGFVGLVFPRSSCYHQRQIMSNCVGVIDSGYRGELKAVMIGTTPKRYIAGDRVAQLVIMPYPKIEFVESESLSETSRGTNSYGSTGK